MAQFKNYDRARNSCSTESTGALTIGDALTPGNSIKARMATGDTAKFYFIKSPSQWISFLGTFTSPDQLARTRIIDGSSGLATNVDFGAGAGEIGMDVPAEDLDALNLIPVPVTSAATTDIGALYGKIVAINGTTGPVTNYGATTINKQRRVIHNGEIVNHNPPSISLLGGVNWPTNVGDISDMKQDASGNWAEHFRSSADGRYRAPNGSVALPSFSFPGDPDSGLYPIGANNVGIGVNGAKVLDVRTAGVGVVGLLDLSGATSGQAKFPATQVPSADANTLDDYKEFTWTPVLNGFTVVGAPTVVGKGTKIGNVVHWTLAMSAATSLASTAGSSYVGGIPFVPTAFTAFCTVNNAVQNIGIGYCDTSSLIFTPTWAASALLFYANGELPVAT